MVHDFYYKIWEYELYNSISITLLQNNLLYNSRQGRGFGTKKVILLNFYIIIKMAIIWLDIIICGSHAKLFEQMVIMWWSIMNWLITNIVLMKHYYHNTIGGSEKK